MSDKFYERHNIQVLDTNKKWQHRRGMPMPVYFENISNKDMVYNDRMDYYIEPLYTITIPLSNLQKIQDFEDQVFNNMKTYGSQHYMMFEVMMQQRELEADLRHKYPSVKKAFEHYSLLLALAKSGELDA